MCSTRVTLTFNSSDTPLSVSRRELQGNCPVTLYILTEKLKHNITGSFERETSQGTALNNHKKLTNQLCYIISRYSGKNKCDFDLMEDLINCFIFLH